MIEIIIVLFWSEYLSICIKYLLDVSIIFYESNIAWFSKINCECNFIEVLLIFPLSFIIITHAFLLTHVNSYAWFQLALSWSKLKCFIEMICCESLVIASLVAWIWLDLELLYLVEVNVDWIIHTNILTLVVLVSESRLLFAEMMRLWLM